jgi:uncharacterized RDD family membrane protein YckC
LRPAPLARRAIATLLDSLWICALAAVAYALGLAGNGGAAPLTATLEILVVIGLITFLEGGSQGASPGKHVLGLVVADEATQRRIGYGRAFIRVLGFAISGALLYLPLLGAWKRTSRQTWYDRSTRSIVLGPRSSSLGQRGSGAQRSA